MCIKDEKSFYPACSEEALDTPVNLLPCSITKEAML